MEEEPRNTVVTLPGKKTYRVVEERPGEISLMSERDYGKRYLGHEGALLIPNQPVPRESDPGLLKLQQAMADAGIVTEVRGLPNMPSTLLAFDTLNFEQSVAAAQAAAKTLEGQLSADSQDGARAKFLESCKARTQELYTLLEGARKKTGIGVYVNNPAQFNARFPTLATPDVTTEEGHRQLLMAFCNAAATLELLDKSANAKTPQSNTALG